MTAALFCSLCLHSGIQPEEAVPIRRMAKGNEERQDLELLSKPLFRYGQINSIHIPFAIANDKVRSHVRGLAECVKYLESIVQSITTVVSQSHPLFQFLLPSSASTFTSLSLEFTSLWKAFLCCLQTRSHPLPSAVMGLVLFHSMWQSYNELLMQHLMSDFPPDCKLCEGRGSICFAHHFILGTWKSV